MITRCSNNMNGWFGRCLILWLATASVARSLATSKTPAEPTKVLVTGASGRTGQLVLDALLADRRFEPRALVRSEPSAKKLRKALPDLGLDQIIVCDVTTLAMTGSSSDKSQRESALNNSSAAFRGVSKMIICSSAVPVISKRSLFLAFLKVPWNLIRKRKAVDFTTLRFRWKRGQYPELVDFHGQTALVDLAKTNGMDQVVVVGSMGGTDPSNFLNAVGKKPDGSGNGDILLWKRKGEKYLVDSGLNYCIIHPGGLKDTPAGQEEFVLDVDDVLLERTKRTISRADVADLCIASLTVAQNQKVAFDCVTQPLDSSSSDKIPSAAQALEAFLATKKEYTY